VVSVAIQNSSVFFGFSLVGSDILLMTNRLSAFLCFSPSILFFFSVCLFVIVD